MRQILIEKYIKPSETNIGIFYFIESWFNKYGELHSYLGQPSENFYGKDNGKLKAQTWHKKGIQHRDKDLPAEINYDSNGEIIEKYWLKKGELHRDNDLPAEIYYEDSKKIYKSYYKKGALVKEEFLTKNK
jgi:hypothetical protein